MIDRLLDHERKAKKVSRILSHVSPYEHKLMLCIQDRVDPKYFRIWE